MAFEGRQLVVAGPTMVYLKGGAHYSGQPVGICAEMGLCQEEVRVEINFLKDDVRSEDFGQQAPADVRFQMATARITMTLLHYDPFVVETAIQESLGGRPFPWGGDFIADQHHGAGKLGMPGALMGGRKAMYASGPARAATASARTCATASASATSPRCPPASRWAASAAWST
jgi:hypothetical protein